MNQFYGEIPLATSPKVQQIAKPLGIFTKSQVIHAPQGFQRIHDFLLQDQSAKLLPRERVGNCLKKRIDKDKLREVKYNESRKKLIGLMFSVVALFGHVLFVPSKLLKSVGKNLKRLFIRGKRAIRALFNY